MSWFVFNNSPHFSYRVVVLLGRPALPRKNHRIGRLAPRPPESHHLDPELLVVPEVEHEEEPLPLLEVEVSQLRRRGVGPLSCRWIRLAEAGVFHAPGPRV